MESIIPTISVIKIFAWAQVVLNCTAFEKRRRASSSARSALTVTDPFMHSARTDSAEAPAKHRGCSRSKQGVGKYGHGVHQRDSQAATARMCSLNTHVLLGRACGQAWPSGCGDAPKQRVQEALHRFQDPLQCGHYFNQPAHRVQYGQRTVHNTVERKLEQLSDDSLTAVSQDEAVHDLGSDHDSDDSDQGKRTKARVPLLQGNVCGHLPTEVHAQQILAGEVADQDDKEPSPGDLHNALHCGRVHLACLRLLAMRNQGL
eukprot:scaffold9141_cov70-Phaeocystis_antarctica.AAC.8